MQSITITCRFWSV